MEYTDFSIRDIQKKSLEIFKIFDKFCEDNSLRYFLCGGALIGAVRNKGFIPWDDDIDCFMFREDYEKLVSLWNAYDSSGRYSMLRSDRDNFYDTMLTQFSDNNTAFIKSDLENSDINHGLKIEILPLDACAEGRISRKIQILWALAFCLFNRAFIPQNKGRIVRYCSIFALKIFRSYKSRYRLWRFAEKRMTKRHINQNTQFLTELCVTYKYLVNKYPKGIFDQTVRLDFEDMKVSAPAGYDEYLTIAFGDYMTPPPPEEQVIKHKPVFVDLNNSYLNYRGIHYSRH